MSIVDTWDWYKLNLEEYDDEVIEMDVNMKVQNALYEFECLYNIRPNRIVMGYYLVNELHNQFNPTKTLKEVEKEFGGLKCEYEGIPIEIDYRNLDNLEVGVMAKWNDIMY